MAKSKLIKDIALDKISLETALQRLLIITYELNNTELENWIQSELNGYIKEEQLPSYRKKIGYIIRYSGFDGNVQVKRQILSESFFSKEIKEILQNRFLKEGINVIEDVVTGDSEVIYNLIELAGMVHSNSNGFITCFNLEQVVSKTSFLKILSCVKSKLIAILLDLEKEFGILDDLDIDVESKNDEKLEEINKSIIHKIYYDGKSENI